MRAWEEVGRTKSRNTGEAGRNRWVRQRLWLQLGPSTSPSKQERLQASGTAQSRQCSQVSLDSFYSTGPRSHSRCGCQQLLALPNCCCSPHPYQMPHLSLSCPAAPEPIPSHAMLSESPILHPHLPALSLLSNLLSRSSTDPNSPSESSRAKKSSFPSPLLLLLRSWVQAGG